MARQADKKHTLSFLIFVFCVIVGCVVLAFSLSPDSKAQDVATSVIKGEKIYNPDLLESFYKARNDRPLWLRGYTGFQPRANAVLKILGESWSHGLNPENYHVQTLRNLLVSSGDESRRKFDLLMSDGVIRYVRDLTGMRGIRADSGGAYKYWREPMEAEQVLKEVGESANPADKLHVLAPTGKLYLALRRELINLVHRQNQKIPPIEIKGVLKPGSNNMAVPALRSYFGLPNTKSTLYDDDLAAQVIKFQRRNGQNADGIIRANTLKELNRAPEDRIFQILANMERLRWIEQGRPERYVLVNIPSASLWAVDHGNIALEMPVIVGKAARPTYSFKTEISGVRFNPNWTVPTTIKTTDFLPALQQDPTVLTRKGIRILYKGQEVDPMAVDWSVVTPQDLKAVRMVQDPSDENPLGKVRVIMENPYDIYLHDTNHREMFVNDDRTLSSGCIRVSQPEKLADFILKNNKGWSWRGMQKIIETGKMRDVTSEEKIPVYITYQTIWLDSEGKLIYGRDVYDQDRKLAEILKKSGGIHIPEGAEISEISL